MIAERVLFSNDDMMVTDRRITVGSDAYTISQVVSVSVENPCQQFSKTGRTLLWVGLPMTAGLNCFPLLCVRAVAEMTTIEFAPFLLIGLAGFAVVLSSLIFYASKTPVHLQIRWASLRVIWFDNDEAHEVADAVRRRMSLTARQERYS